MKKNMTSGTTQNKNSLFEFATAFIVMTIVLIIFIKRSNNTLVTKVETMDTTVHRTNAEVVKLNDSLQFFFPYFRRIDQDNAENITRQQELLDNLIRNNSLIEENNQLLENQGNILKNIDKKQNTIINNTKNDQNIDSFFRKKFEY
jgi:cell shape-determining protein MreC